MQRIMLLVLVATLATLLVVAVFASPVEAGTTYGPWIDTGDCCDTWTPGLQDTQRRTSQYCWQPGQCYPLQYEYRCKSFTFCP